MKVIHSFNGLKICKDIREGVSFILSNKKGGYCFLANKPSSRYQGIFFNYNFNMYKVVEEIRLVNGSSVEELRNNFFSVERKRGNIIESFFMPYGFNSIVYELNKESEVEIVLDIRESYSHPEFGRIYRIFEEDNRVVVNYRQEEGVNCCLVISGFSSYENGDGWFKRDYHLDRIRNSPPYEKYVYSALRIKLNKLVCSFSFNKDEAFRENDFVLRGLNRIKNNQKKGFFGIINKNKAVINKIRDDEVRVAYVCALNSLNNLVVRVNNQEGIYGGLPWFFQFWARDEAISLKALSYFEKKGVIKKILCRLIGNIKENKIVAKYPNGDIYSADAIGWLFKRIYETNKKFLGDAKIKDLLKDLDDKLVINDKYETWMDTINRKGYRVEIEALKLFMLKLKTTIFHQSMIGGRGGICCAQEPPIGWWNIECQEPPPSKIQPKHATGLRPVVLDRLEKRLRQEVIEKFWNFSHFRDGINDGTIRPNIFIADYVYPELLSKKEWISCFEYILKGLWLAWGGLSTIDKGSSLFCPVHSGEIPTSYHNGDSWFWINNLAAITLYKTDKKRFLGYVKKILNASASEILWKGAVGNHAELSSASRLRSEGCLMQAWSSAMFIELVNTIKGKNK